MISKELERLLNIYHTLNIYHSFPMFIQIILHSKECVFSP